MAEFQQADDANTNRTPASPATCLYGQIYVRTGNIRLADRVVLALYVFAIRTHSIPFNQFVVLDGREVGRKHTGNTHGEKTGSGCIPDSQDRGSPGLVLS